MKRIAVIPNTGKEEAKRVAEHLLSLFPDNCYAADDDASLASADMVLVLGGDGTILRTIKKCRGRSVLGINFGTLGYMTSAEKDDAEEAVRKLLSGDYMVEERMMLSFQVKRRGQEIASGTALNDGVITRRERILSLSEYLDDRLVYHFQGDGIIVATPTGSTAYSLSAGGPVAPPDMRIIITTPVCPHSIHIRPVIAAPTAAVRLVLSAMDDNEGILNVDGQNVSALLPGDEVIFRCSSETARLICLEQKSFYDILRYKLSADKGEKE